MEDEKGVPVVSGTATTDEEEEFKEGEAAGDGKKGKKSKKKKNGRAASSHLISIQQSGTSSSLPVSPNASSSNRTIFDRADEPKKNSSRGTGSNTQPVTQLSRQRLPALSPLTRL